jgi:hypothetical protein
MMATLGLMFTVLEERIPQISPSGGGCHCLCLSHHIPRHCRTFNPHHDRPLTALSLMSAFSFIAAKWIGTHKDLSYFNLFLL